MEFVAVPLDQVERLWSNSPDTFSHKLFKFIDTHSSEVNTFVSFYLFHHYSVIVNNAFPAI